MCLCVRIQLVVSVRKFCTKSIFEVSWMPFFTETGPEFGIIEDGFPITNSILHVASERGEQEEVEGESSIISVSQGRFWDKCN